MTDPTLIEQVTDELLEKLIAAVITHTEVDVLSNELRMHKRAVKADMVEALATLQGSAALPSEAMIEDALETARQRAVVLFNAYALGVSMEHKRGEEQFIHDVKTFNDELTDALRFPISMRATTPTAPIENLGALSGSHASTEPCGLGPPAFDPARIELALRVMRLFDSFDDPSTDNLWWRTDGEYAPVTMLVNCNDLFLWGCADCEVITTENIAALEATIAEVAKVGEYLEDTAVLLWCCRERQLRPQPPYYKSIDKRLWPLFDACGPNADAAGRLHRPAIATGTAETPQSGSVHEGAGLKDIAHD